MSNVQEKSSKRVFYIVRFEYGDPADPSYRYYTDYTTDRDLRGPRDMSVEKYVSVPSMSIDLGKRSGSMEEGNALLTVPRMLTDDTDLFFHTLSNGDPHSKIKATVTEVITDGAEIDFKVRYQGRCGRIHRNFQGRKERVQIAIYNWKDLTEVALGIPATGRCQHIHGRKGCDRGHNPLVKFEDRMETGVVEEIVHDRLVISGVDPQPHRKPYRRGWVQYDGLRIGIRVWVEGTTNFDLTKPPPAAWLGKTVEVVQGCDKKYRTCKVYKNAEQFAGLGKLIPTHHPIFERGKDD